MWVSVTLKGLGLITLKCNQLHGNFTSTIIQICKCNELHYFNALHSRLFIEWLISYVVNHHVVNSNMLTLLHSELPKLCRVLAVLSAIGLNEENLID